MLVTRHVDNMEKFHDIPVTLIKKIYHVDELEANKGP